MKTNKLFMQVCIALTVIALPCGVAHAVYADSNYIGEAKAKAIALNNAGLNEIDVSYVFCALDYDDGIAEYEVGFWDNSIEYEYKINATTGTITEYEHDTETQAPITPSTNQNYIGVAKAKSIALKNAGLSESKVSFLTCSLDFDNGIAEYDVEFWAN